MTSDSKQETKCSSTRLDGYDLHQSNGKHHSSQKSNGHTTVLNECNENQHDAYEKLNKWKMEMDNELERVYSSKRTEIDNLLKVDTDLVEVNIDDIPVFDKFVKVSKKEKKQEEKQEFDVDRLVCLHEFNLKTSNEVICSSDKYILVYEDVISKLVLYDKQKMILQYDWHQSEYEHLHDMCWSTATQNFLLVTNRHLFTWNPSNDVIKIDCIRPVNGSLLWSITTNMSTDLFILYKLGNFIDRWELPSWRLVQRWSNHDLFAENDQRVRCIRTNDIHVAMTVESMTLFQWRVDIFDLNLNLIRRGFNINNLTKHSTCLLTKFHSDQWLIIDNNKNNMFLVDQNGVVEQKTASKIKHRIKNAVMLDNNQLVLKLQQPNQLQIYLLNQH